eukprot:TRINITY_DN5750_c0_g1_i1.p1 TRINITY_DN5750_c0_g1~~TRINITY_DN5750_c0_g1_i1.p1  ORF type:complete len:357 (-),score=166.39 TRINITY_DN5750_c0_g1_i1:56-1054(-)
MTTTDKDDQVTKQDMQLEEKKKKQKKPVADMTWWSGVYTLGVVGFFMSLAFTAFQTMFALFAFTKFGTTSLEMGFIFSGSAIVFLLAQGVAFNEVQKRLGLLPTCAVGALMETTGMFWIAMPWVDSLAVLLISVFFIGVGSSLFSPGLSTLLSRFASQADQGKVLGAGQSADAMARVVGPILYGVLFDEKVTLPFIVGGCFSLAAIVFMAALFYLSQRCQARREAVSAKADVTSTVKRFRLPMLEEDNLPLLPRKDKKLAQEVGVVLGRMLTARNYDWTAHVPELKSMLSHTFPPLSEEMSERMQELTAIIDRMESWGNEWQHSGNAQVYNF